MEENDEEIDSLATSTFSLPWESKVCNALSLLNIDGPA